MTTENEDNLGLVESLRKEVKRLENDLGESSAKIDVLRKSHEDDVEEIKSRHERQIARLKKTISETEDDVKREKSEIRRNLEKLYKEESNKLIEERDEIKEKSNLEIVELNSQMDRLKETHEEELLVAENNKQQALMLAQQEQNALKERIDQLTKNLDEVRDNSDSLKREHVKRVDKDRNQIASLQLEVSRMKAQLEDTNTKLGGEKSQVEDFLRKERDLKTDLETQLRTVKTNLKYANEKVDNLTEELDEVRKKLIQSEENMNYSHGEVTETGRKLRDAKTQIERIEKAKAELQNALNVTDADKQEQQKRIEELESKITDLEVREGLMRKELREARDLYTESEENGRFFESRADEMQRKLKSIESRHRELEMEREVFRVTKNGFIFSNKSCYYNFPLFRIALLEKMRYARPPDARINSFGSEYQSLKMPEAPWRGICWPPKPSCRRASRAPSRG